MGMSQIRETRDTVTISSTESLTESKQVRVINSTDETEVKLEQITSDRRSVSGPGARLHCTCFCISR